MLDHLASIPEHSDHLLQGLYPGRAVLHYFLARIRVMIHW